MPGHAHRTAHRTHTCGELRPSDEGETVRLAGWVQGLRDHGGLVFIDLRDRFGRTQVVFSPEEDGDLHARASELRSEDVIRVEGAVRTRPEEAANPDLPTGGIEVGASELTVFSRAGDLPFELSSFADVGAETRFRHRTLDLRRPEAQAIFAARHRVVHTMRTHLDERGFWDVETPCLTRSTPEGARDFIVPSRVEPGSFYALPQSPQLFKQMLMCSGFDRYFQIARCFRDEDLRADRQPEFTQLDLEMAFCGQEDVLRVVEGLMRAVTRAVRPDVDLPDPFPRIPYDEAMARYGCDDPDVRFALELFDVTDVARECSFRVFSSVADDGGRVQGLRVPDGASLSRSEIDELEGFCREHGAKGLAWMKVEAGEGGPEATGGVSKFFSPDEVGAFLERAGAGPGDLLGFVADRPATVRTVLAALRERVGADAGLIPEDECAYCWIVDPPLLEANRDTGEPTPAHHPFTAPVADDLGRLESDPLSVRARAYDLVLNGSELGSGSIRIHAPEVQERVFAAIGIDRDAARRRFGFLLEAMDHGAPPHGGIALGLDRIVMKLCAVPNIREVIPFPKNHRGVCPLTGAPAPVDADQLADLGVAVLPAEEED